MTKRPETDVGAPVVERLREMHWDVYQEVTTGGIVADIVGTLGRLVWVIECKTSLTFDVIAQALRWKQAGFAHYVSVAVPGVKFRSDGRRLAMRVLEREGIGCFEVVEKKAWPGTVLVVEELARASLLRSARHVQQLRDCLHDAQKSQVAGTAGGGHYTPFRNTCDQLRRVVVANPGITMKDALGKIEHHYRSDATARSALPVWVEKGRIEGVRLEVTGGRRHLYPTGAT